MRSIIGACVSTLQLLLFAPMEASAQRLEIVPHYQDILPADFVPPAAPLDAASLRDAKVVLIPSTNFNSYSAWWANTYAPDRRMNSFQRMMGLNDDVHRLAQNPSDPRNFPDTIVEMLRPTFREVSVADDITGAREQGADLFLVVDFWQKWQWMDLDSSAGIYLLDKDLNEVLALSNDARVHYRDGGGGLFCMIPCQMRLAALTHEDGYAAVTAPIFASLQARLAAPTP